jgi:hypothetical protein
MARLERSFNPCCAFLLVLSNSRKAMKLPAKQANASEKDATHRLFIWFSRSNRLRKDAAISVARVCLNERGGQGRQHFHRTALAYIWPV